MVKEYDETEQYIAAALAEARESGWRQGVDAVLEAVPKNGCEISDRPQPDPEDMAHFRGWNAARRAIEVIASSRIASTPEPV